LAIRFEPFVKSDGALRITPIERQSEENLLWHAFMHHFRMNCSVWLLISKVLNAPTVTSVMAVTSASVSLLIAIPWPVKAVVMESAYFVNRFMAREHRAACD
jgi:hypothetical protein